MTTNSEIILSEYTHTPANSDLATVVGLPFKGDGYYGRSDGLHTVQYTYTGLSGDIIIQATLVLDPIEDDWFEVQSYSPNDETASRKANFTGNYHRHTAKLQFTDATDNSIRLNH